MTSLSERLRAATTASEILTAELVLSWPAALSDAIALRCERAINQGHVRDAAGIAGQVAATYYGDMADTIDALRDALMFFATTGECADGFNVNANNNEHNKQCFECRGILTARAALARLERP